MSIHNLNVEQALASLKTSMAVLAVAEAKCRQAEFGPKHVEEVGRESLLLTFAREFPHFSPQAPRCRRPLRAELGAILAIIYTEPGNWLFGTAPLGAEVWLLAVLGAGVIWVVEEARKAWLRRLMVNVP